MLQSDLEYKNSANSFRISVRQAVGHYSMNRFHLHNSYELYYLLSGERYYFIKDRTFHVEKGDLILISQHVLHKTNDTGVPNHQRALIHFTPEFTAVANSGFASLLERLFENHPVIRLPLTGQAQTETILQQIYNEAQEQKDGFEFAIQSLLLQLIVFAYRNTDQNLFPSAEYPSPMHKKISEIVQYINENYAEPLNLTSVSERFFISPYYLSRSFKEATGFTFVEYLNSVRIREAQQLLRNSRLKVIQIAEQVGFGSIAHFGRVFKSLIGRSPLNYRKKE